MNLLKMSEKTLRILDAAIRDAIDQVRQEYDAEITKHRNEEDWSACVALEERKSSDAAELNALLRDISDALDLADAQRRPKLPEPFGSTFAAQEAELRAKLIAKYGEPSKEE